jgi:hypothetical protein
MHILSVLPGIKNKQKVLERSGAEPDHGGGVCNHFPSPKKKARW